MPDLATPHDLRLRLLCAAVLLVPALVTAAPPLDARRPATVEALRALPPGAATALAKLDLPGRAGAHLELERFDVFAPGAAITENGPAGTRRLVAPELPVFHGRVAGLEDSAAFLAVRPDGSAAGFVRLGRELLALGAARGAGVTARPLDADAEGPAPFLCGADGLAGPAAASGGSAAFAAAAVEAAVAADWGTTYEVTVAVETDAELYALLGSSEATLAYLGELFAGASAIYRRDVNVQLRIGSVSLWSTGTASDPWRTTEMCSGLLEFGDYWHANHRATPRHLAHFVSGRRLGGGIAWVGVLGDEDWSYPYDCSGAPGSHWGGAYGLSANLAGTYDLASNPTVWDIVVVSHEIGHNLDSPHTHCYSPAVDECYNGQNACFDGATSVPAGGGSLMSYCHLTRGLMSDINLAFGAPGQYGNHSERVPQRMRAHVLERASLLGTAGGAIFGDGFEGGSLGAWSAGAR